MWTVSCLTLLASQHRWQQDKQVYVKEAASVIGLSPDAFEERIRKCPIKFSRLKPQLWVTWELVWFLMFGLSSLVNLMNWFIVRFWFGDVINEISERACQQFRPVQSARNQPLLELEFASCVVSQRGETPAERQSRLLIVQVHFQFFEGEFRQEVPAVREKLDQWTNVRSSFICRTQTEQNTSHPDAQGKPFGVRVWCM